MVEMLQKSTLALKKDLFFCDLDVIVTDVK